MELLFKILTSPAPDYVCVGDTNFKDHYPHVHKSMSWGVLLVSIKQVTRDLIVPYVTEEAYNELAGKYNGPDPHITISASEAKVIELLQDAIAHYVIWKDAVPRSIAIGDIGTVTAHGKDGMANPVESWRLSHFYWTTMKSADFYLDRAVTFMENDLERFPTYASSRDDLQIADFFVNTTAIVQEHFSIMDSYRTFTKLIPSLKKAHSNVYALLGSNQFEDLLVGYQTQGTPLSAAYQALIDLIQEYCSLFAVWHALPRLDVMIEGDSVVVVSSLEGIMKSVQQAQDNRVDALRCELEVDFKSAYKKIESYLRLHTEDFPIWAVENDEDDGLSGVPYSFGDGGVFLL